MNCGNVKGTFVSSKVFAIKKIRNSGARAISPRPPLNNFSDFLGEK